MKIKDIYVIKKDGTKQSFDGEKIVRAINASAKRIGEILSAEDEERTVELVLKNIHEAEVPILTMHSLVEEALDEVNPKVAKCYRDYRNYKTDMARMLAEVNGEADKVLFGVDRSNANSDGNLVSTKRALIFGAYEKTMYREFFLNKEERQADKDGYIYVHDKSARMITMNCCLFDMEHTAVISSDNMDPVDADHGVTVNPKEEEKPALSIDKNVNLSSASVGDTLSYTLTVKETEKDQTAKNVVVRDNFDTTGMKVGGIQATLDGKSIKADVTKADNGFVVNTNTDLAYGSTLKITYQAVVSDSSLAGKMVGNTAIASADNADDVAANAGVSIAENPSPSETPAPSTTPAPGADSSDNTTNTVGPKTGLVNHAGMYAGIGLGIVAVAAIAVFVMRRKKK